MLPLDFWILIERYPKAMIQIKIFVAQKKDFQTSFAIQYCQIWLTGQALAKNFLTNSFVVGACREESQKKVIKAP